MNRRVYWIMATSLGFGLSLSPAACSKVPNPYYIEELGDEASSESSSGSTDESSTGSTDESSESSTESTESSTGSTDESSSTDTDCPPSESGCPCLDGTMCFPGLTCIAGVCLAPDDCTPEDPNVHVEWTYDIGGMQPAADTTCTVGATMQANAVALAIGGCDDGTTTLGILLDPMPPELAPVLLVGDTPGTVRLHFEQGTAFIRLALPGWGLWLVEGMLLVSGNAAVSDYPGEVAAVVGECPGTPKFCGNEVGELDRRGVRMLGQPVFDGSSALLDGNAYGWVDLARVDCGVPSTRFALIDW